MPHTFLKKSMRFYIFQPYANLIDKKGGVKMEYKFVKQVKDNDILRKSFNELTQQTFGFDFEDWYRSGHWQDMYIPHVLLDGEKVISNVSVNTIQFDIKGEIKNYIQLGTVMTDEAYRGQGLNRQIMEKILEEYKDKVDGFYLFGNDEVLDYYPKFGFKPIKEYEYYMPCENLENVDAYTMQKVDMEDKMQCEKLYDFIRNYTRDMKDGEKNVNQNDGLYMSENIGLYQFWFAAGFGENVYYLSEVNAYVLAEENGETLHIQQVFGREKVDMLRFAKSFGENLKEVVFDYTPYDTKNLLVREHKEEDCTLFILGEDLERIERDKMLFPVMSHA